MSIEETAAALAPAPEPVIAETPAETPELSEDASLDAAWDRAHAGETEAQPETQPEAQPEAVAEEAPAEIQAPTDMPAGVRESWKDLTPTAREAVQGSLREMQRKLADAGRVSSGLAPIKDSLIRAATELPHLANMRPEDVADQVFELAKISASFANEPTKTLIGYAQQHGLLDELRSALGVALGEGEKTPQGDMANTIRSLQAEVQRQSKVIEQFNNPEYLHNQFDTYSTQKNALSTVQEFAESKPHWAELEPHMPAFVSVAQATNPGASAQDVLGKAYEMALAAILPDEKAKLSQAAVQAAAKADPARTEAALKAKSVNVAGKPTGKTRVLTEDEALDLAWERAQSR